MPVRTHSATAAETVPVRFVNYTQTDGQPHWSDFFLSFRLSFPSFIICTVLYARAISADDFIFTHHHHHHHHHRELVIDVAVVIRSAGTTYLLADISGCLWLRRRPEISIHGLRARAAEAIMFSLCPIVLMSRANMDSSAGRASPLHTWLTSPAGFWAYYKNSYCLTWLTYLLMTAHGLNSPVES